MTSTNKRSARRGQDGQTLLIAMLVLGVLLVLGLVFIGLISRNIRSASRMNERSRATDLAEAGVRYAHFQLLHSELGADWLPSMTDVGAGPTSVDPDVLYLRPAPYLNATNGPLGLRYGADPQVDLGGPDGLGPFTRVNFDGGRALVRVRYAPSDSNIFSTDPAGSVRSPGKARFYLTI